MSAGPDKGGEDGGGQDGGVLLDAYDALLLDLDGVLYTGGVAVPGAVEALDAARRRGVPLAFVTNNASRTPDRVAERLTALGVTAAAHEVHTSSQAAARLVLDRFGPHARVLPVGGPGVAAALREVGLEPVTAEEALDDVPDAVVQGLGQDVTWRDLAEAAFAVQGGALWVATNRDPTVPTERGPAPGNGSLVAAVRAAAGVDPVVAGKPEPPLMRLALEATGGRRGLVVGDRLDTDVAGATAVGVTGALVLTGVNGPHDLLAAPPGQRPDLVLPDLLALHAAAPPRPVRDGDAWCCGAARATAAGGRLDVTGDGGADGLDRLRAAACAAWAAADAGTPVDAGSAATGLVVGAGR